MSRKKLNVKVKDNRLTNFYFCFLFFISILFYFRNLELELV